MAKLPLKPKRGRGVAMKPTLDSLKKQAIRPRIKLESKAPDQKYEDSENFVSNRKISLGRLQLIRLCSHLLPIYCLDNGL